MGTNLRQSDPTSVPSLDPILADVSLFKSLSREEQDRLYSAIAGLEAFMRAHLLLTRLSSHEAPASQEPDRAVPLAEAARMLSMSKDYLYRHWHELHGYRDKDGKIKFRLTFINYYLRQKERGR